MNPTTFGDDCLNLNVWTPDPATSGLPVMVWVHGGGYMSGGGAAPINDGATWARDGIVYVSINYRMSVDGFVYFGGDTANLGLQDQVAALRWVQDNIAAFGGDPGNVTVFGQSAGGVSVMNLLAMPSASGLFRGAIAQSGSSMATADLAFETRVRERLSEVLGVPPTAEGFASVPVDRLTMIVGSLGIEYLSPALWGEESFLISAFRSVIDGDVLPSEIVPAIRAGASADVDIMAGTTRDEMTFAMQPLGLLGTDDVPDFWADVALDTFGLVPDDLDAYRKGSRPDATRGELLMAAWTDWAFRIPTLRVLEAHAPQAGRTYGYEMTWPSPQLHLGAVHALEIPFVNDALAAFSAGFEGSELDPLGAAPPQSLADAMHSAWVRFAESGDPGWPQYDERARATMRFDATSEVVDDLAGVERELWEGRR
jgi:para-nitrobenzyl esterase